MWRVIWFFLGVTRLQVTGASPEWCLQRLAKARVPFHFCGKPDAFTAGIWILRRDEARVTRLVRAAGCECHVEERGGFPAIFGGLQRRLWLPVLLLAAAAAAVIVPKFVFFYTVEGNETVPSAQILRELQELGVGFGTYGPSIKPQELKNQMLLRIPKLQWLTVQQSGMRAVVVVRERPEKEPVLDRRSPVNVVAARARTGGDGRGAARLGLYRLRLQNAGDRRPGRDLRRDHPQGHLRSAAAPERQGGKNRPPQRRIAAGRSAADRALWRRHPGKALRKRDKNLLADTSRRLFFAVGDCNYRNL